MMWGEFAVHTGISGIALLGYPNGDPIAAFSIDIYSG